MSCSFNSYFFLILFYILYFVKILLKNHELKENLLKDEKEILDIKLNMPN